VSYELTDLEDFSTNLKKMYDGVFSTFYFQQIDEYFVLKFSSSKEGDVLISGHCLNSNHSIKTDFEYYSDQSFLPDLISQVDQVVNSLSS
jgi:hypothetical protein